jgi:hypothetical protein
MAAPLSALVAIDLPAESDVMLRDGESPSPAAATRHTRVRRQRHEVRSTRSSVQPRTSDSFCFILRQLAHVAAVAQHLGPEQVERAISATDVQTEFWLSIVERHEAGPRNIMLG